MVFPAPPTILDLPVLLFIILLLAPPQINDCGFEIVLDNPPTIEEYIAELIELNCPAPIKEKFESETLLVKPPHRTLLFELVILLLLPAPRNVFSPPLIALVFPPIILE